MKFTLKRTASLIAALLLLIQTFSVIVTAEDEEDNVIEIYTIADLYCVRYDLDGNYKLMADIDLTEATAKGGDWDDNGKGWLPIGNVRNPFMGTFDGNGHSIIGMRIRQNLIESGEAVGLFGSAEDATFTNLKLMNSSISVTAESASLTARTYAGSVCGKIKNCTIKNCGSKNISITAESHSSNRFYTGGLIGGSIETNNIEECFTTGEITGGDWTYFGGIIGIYANGNINNCYSTTKLISRTGNANYPCGIGRCSDNNYCVVDRCLFFGEIECIYYRDAISNGEYTNCYIKVGCNGSYNNENATAVTEAQMKLSPVFGYLDFDSVWFLDLDSGVMHPQLRGMPEALSATELTWVTEPTNREIAEGTEEPDFTDGVIHAEYKYGSAKDINVTSDMVSGFDGTTVGSQPLTVEHCGKTLSFDVNVVHDYKEAVTLPTCTTRGYTTHVCSACGDSYTDKYTDKLVHAYRAAVTEPTCTSEGYTTHTCLLCGDMYVDSYSDKCAHTYTSQVINATCTAQGYTKYVCSVCGNTYISDYTDVCEHSYEAVVVEPDCVNGGYTKHVCKDCGHTYTDTPAECKGHDYIAVITPATCRKKGYTTYTCKDCSESYVADYTELASHKYTAEVTEPTCSSIGYTTYTCSECGCSYVDNYTERAEHTYLERKVLPDCVNEGYTVFTCSDCGYEYVSNHIPALGHNYCVDVTEATCESDGYTTYTCTECKYSYRTDYTERKGHSFGDFEKYDDEYHIHSCTCGKSEKLPHNWSSGMITKAPTNTEEGETRYICRDCGAVKTVPVDKLIDNAELNVNDIIVRVGREFSATISVSELMPILNCGVWFAYDTDIFEFADGESLLAAEPEICDIDVVNGLAVLYGDACDINGDIVRFDFKVKDDAAEGTYFIEYLCVFANVDENDQSTYLTYSIKEPVTVTPAFIRGDVNDSGAVNSVDALYLLRHTMRASQYPLNQSGDMNGDGKINSVDAIYLLRYTMRPSKYPLF